MNPKIVHPKLEAIPIGLMTKNHPDGGGQLGMWEKLLRQRVSYNIVATHIHNFF